MVLIKIPDNFCAISSVCVGDGNLKLSHPMMGATVKLEKRDVSG